MRGAWYARWREVLRAQDGFTLPELLVVIALLPVVVGGLLLSLDTANKVGPKGFEYGGAIRDAGEAVSRMVREIHQASRVVGTTDNSITFDAVFNGHAVRVSILCDLVSGAPGSAERRCMRVQAQQGSPLPAYSTGTVEVDRLLNDPAAQPVFSFSPDPIAPTYVGITVQVPAAGTLRNGLQHPMTITNGTVLPNTQLGV